MQGKRHDFDEADWQTLAPGEYGKSNGKWYCRVPGDDNLGVGGLAKHEVVEHEDGTITVSPSILLYDKDGKPAWHGYLERGVWREV